MVTFGHLYLQPSDFGCFVKDCENYFVLLRIHSRNTVNWGRSSTTMLSHRVVVYMLSHTRHFYFPHQLDRWSRSGTTLLSRKVYSAFMLSHMSNFSFPPCVSCWDVTSALEEKQSLELIRYVRLDPACFPTWGGTSPFLFMQLRPLLFNVNIITVDVNSLIWNTGIFIRISGFFELSWKLYTSFFSFHP